MNGSAGLEAAWREHHPYLVNLAYRMVGDIGDAEDVAQEAFLRLARTDPEHLDDVRAWLTVVTGRLCLDHACDRPVPGSSVPIRASSCNRRSPAARGPGRSGHARRSRFAPPCSRC